MAKYGTTAFAKRDLQRAFSRRFTEGVDYPALVGKSLGFFEADGYARRGLHRVLYSPYANTLMFVVVILAVSALIARPFVAQSGVSGEQLMGLLNAIISFTGVLFTVEAMAYIITLGLTGKGSYLEDPWHALDLVIVFSIWIEVCGDLFDFNFASLVGFRLLRALLYMRQLPVFLGVKSIFLALSDASFLMINILQVLFFFFAVFGILGMEAFSGSLQRHCVDPQSGADMKPRQFCKHTDAPEQELLSSCPTSYGQVLACRVGRNPYYNIAGFDNFGTALVTLFHTSSLDEWPAHLMHPLIQAEPGFPIWLYFCSFVVLTSFVTVNLFVAVITSAFERVRLAEGIHVFVGERLVVHGDASELANLADDDVREVLQEVAEEWKHDPALFAERTREKMTALMAMTQPPDLELEDAGDDFNNEFANQPTPGAVVAAGPAGEWEPGKPPVLAPRGPSVFSATRPPPEPEPEAAPLAVPPSPENFPFTPSARHRGSLMNWTPPRSPSINRGRNPPSPSMRLPPRSPSMGRAFRRESTQAVEGLPRRDSELIFRRDSEFMFKRGDTADSLRRGDTQDSLRRGGDSPDSTPFRRGDTADSQYLRRGDSAEMQLKRGESGSDGLSPQASSPRASPPPNRQQGRGHRQVVPKPVTIEPPGRLEAAQIGILRFANHALVVRFVLACILVNVVFLAIEHHNMPEAQVFALSLSEYFFLSVFGLECIMKLLGFGPKSYFRDPDNRFDFAVLILGWAGVAVELQYPDLPNVSVFKVFRLGRLLRLLRRIRRLWALVLTVIRAGLGLFNLLIFSLISVLSFAVLGVELFRTKFLLAGSQDYQDVPNAIFALFKVVTGDNWTTQMYLGMSSDADPLSLQYILDTLLGSVYFIIFFVFSNYVILNLLIAVILENFDLSREDQIRALRQRLKQEGAENPELVNRLKSRQSQSQLQGALGRGFKGLAGLGAGLNKKMVQVAAAQAGAADESKTSEDDPAARQMQNEQALPEWMVTLQRQHDEEEQAKIDAARLKKERLHDKMRLVFLVRDNEWFQRATFLSLVVFTIQLLLEGPRSHDRETAHDGVMIPLDYFLLFLFLVEVGIKLLGSFGMFWKSGWETMDLGVCIFMLIEVGLGSALGPRWAAQGEAFRLFRAARCLRILNFVRWHPALRSASRTLIGSLPAVGYVVMLYMIVLFAFAVLGVQLFMGKLYICNFPAALGVQDCVGNWAPSNILMPKVWDRPLGHFDDTLEAALTLFRVTTFEWLTPFDRVAAITEEDVQPSPNETFGGAAVFFVSFIFVSRFFVYTLFVAVIVRYFKISAGVKLLSLNQKKWLETRNLFTHLRFDAHLRPSNFVRLRCFEVVAHPFFDPFIAACILINTMLLMTRTVAMHHLHEQTLSNMNDIFLAIYFVELVMKMLAWGPGVYFGSAFNTFDFFVVAGSVVAFFAGEVLADFSRMLRVIRTVRLVRLRPNLLTLFVTLYRAVPSLLSIVGLFFIVLCMWTALGVALFGDVKFGKQLGQAGNFSSFSWGALTLFQVMSGDSWDVLMDDCRLSEPFCTNLSVGGVTLSDCGNPFAAIFFVTFYIVTALVLLNLFVATVLENFTYVIDMVEPLIDTADLDDFMEVWYDYDMDNTGYVHISLLRCLMADCIGPFACARPGFGPRRFFLCVRADLVRQIERRREHIPLHLRATWMLRRAAYLLRDKFRAKMHNTKEKLEHMQGHDDGASVSGDATSVSQGETAGFYFKDAATARAAAARTAKALGGNRADMFALVQKRLEHARRDGMHLTEEDIAQDVAEMWGAHAREYRQTYSAAQAERDRVRRLDSFLFNEILTTIIAWNVSADHFAPGERQQRDATMKAIEREVSVSIIGAYWKRHKMLKSIRGGKRGKTGLGVRSLSRLAGRWGNYSDDEEEDDESVAMSAPAGSEPPTPADRLKSAAKSSWLFAPSSRGLKVEEPKRPPSAESTSTSRGNSRPTTGKQRSRPGTANRSGVPASLLTAERVQAASQVLGTPLDPSLLVPSGAPVRERPVTVVDLEKAEYQKRLASDLGGGEFRVLTREERRLRRLRKQGKPVPTRVPEIDDEFRPRTAPAQPLFVDDVEEEEEGDQGDERKDSEEQSPGKSPGVDKDAEGDKTTSSPVKPRPLKKSREKVRYSKPFIGSSLLQYGVQLKVAAINAFHSAANSQANSVATLSPAEPHPNANSPGNPSVNTPGSVLSAVSRVESGGTASSPEIRSARNAIPTSILGFVPATALPGRRKTRYQRPKLKGAASTWDKTLGQLQARARLQTEAAAMCDEDVQESSTGVGLAVLRGLGVRDVGEKQEKVIPVMVLSTEEITAHDARRPVPRPDRLAQVKGVRYKPTLAASSALLRPSSRAPSVSSHSKADVDTAERDTEVATAPQRVEVLGEQAEPEAEVETASRGVAHLVSFDVAPTPGSPPTFSDNWGGSADNDSVDTER